MQFVFLSSTPEIQKKKKTMLSDDSFLCDQVAFLKSTTSQSKCSMGFKNQFKKSQLLA